MTTPEPMTIPDPASPARDASHIAGELHETYHAVSAAMDLLYEVSRGSVHPALRQARRCGDDALELAEQAKTVLDQGIARIRTGPDGQRFPDLEAVLDALTSVRTRLGAAAERIAPFPARITAAQVRLTATEHPDGAIDTLTERWTGAAEQLRLMAASLTDAVRALAAYADEVAGTSGDA